MKKTFYVRTYDNQTLYASADGAERPKAVVVIVHGLCEHSGRYDYLTKKLNAADFSVYRFDHRGHGRSQGRRICLDDKFALGEDVNSVVEIVKRENPRYASFRDRAQHGRTGKRAVRDDVPAQGKRFCPDRPVRPR